MRLNLFLGCGQFALFARQTILDHFANRVVGWGSVMGLDPGRVLKRAVLCPHCKEDYLFTLRDIADNPELRCHGCGGSIRLSDRVYESLLSDVGNALDEIDSAPPSFVSARHRAAV
jgi:PHP family Zn ribbon phosphoesterase